MARTFKILESFTDLDRSITLAELTRRTGLPKSTVHRIASDLAQMGMLERDGADFRLGIQLFELGQLVPDARRLREVALPFIEDLFEASREIIHLGVLSGRDILYLVKVAGHNQIPLPTRDGGRMPAHATSLGKAILAHSPRSVVMDVLSGGLRPVTPYTIAAPNVLLEQLAEIARTGVAYDNEESVLGTRCVGAAILDKHRRARAAISITGPSSRFDPQKYAAAVKVAASGISREVAVIEPAPPSRSP